MAQHDISFKLQVETASLHAWPGVDQELVMGWEARFAGGHTKRANSASPLPPLVMVPEHIDACEKAYADYGQPAILKIPDFLDPVVDALLDQRGYTIADPTLVLTRSLADIPEDEALSGMTLGTWLPAWSACNGKPTPPPAHRIILENRMQDAVYACVSHNGQHASCGLGVVENELFGIFDICTREDMRRNGHARTLMRGLLAAGRRAGASTCFLQVVKTNKPARALYESLGFTPLYTYWYRIQP